MADFSKQYIDNHDPGGFTPDFDILKEFDGLEDGFYTPIICEGYGFNAILNENGICKLIYKNDDNTIKDIVSLSELDEYYQREILPSLK